MLKLIYKLGKFFERFERTAPRIFWGLVCSLSLSLSLFNGQDVQNPCKSQQIIQNCPRGGRKFDTDFHRRLELRFPD